MAVSNHSDLEISVLRYVSDPGECVVATCFLYFQIPHLEPGNCEVGNLELERNGHFLELFSVGAAERWKVEAGAHHIFSLSRELLQAPAHRVVLVWHIFR